MASKAKDILVRILGDGADLQKELNSAARSLEVVGRKAERIGRDLSLKVTAPIVAAGAAILATTFKAAAFAESIQEISARTGIAQGDVQRLQYASEQLGTEFGAIEGAVAALNRNLATLDAKGSDSAQVLRNLGINARNTQGELRPMSELFPEIISRLQRVSNETERNVAMTKLFGRSALELAPILNAGGAELERLMKRADDLGIVLDDLSVKKLADFKDQTDEVRAQLRNLGADVGLAVLPVLQELIPFIQTTVVPALSRWAEIIRNLDGDTLKAIGTTVGLIAVVGPALKVVGAATTIVAGSFRGLGLLLTPQGALLSGMAILVGLLVKEKLAALGASIETAKLAAALNQMSAAERAARGLALEVNLRGARTELDYYKRALEQAQVASQGIVDARTLTNLKTAQENVARVTRRISELEVEQRLLNDANAAAAAGNVNLSTTIEGLDEILAGLNATTEETEKKVRGVKDVLAELAAALEGAGALDQADEKFDQSVLAVSALEDALQELVRMGLRPGDAALDLVAGNLAFYRQEVATAAAHTDALTDARRLLAEVISGGLSPMQQLLAQMTALEQAEAQGFITTRELIAARESLLQQMQEVRDRDQETAKESGRTWQEEWAGSVLGALTQTEGGWKAWGSGVIREVKRVTAQLLALRAIMLILSPFAGSTGILGSLFKAASSSFGGGKASGGPVQAGKIYPVGERGMELFAPGVSGTIIPSHALAGAGGRGGPTGAELVAAMGPIPTGGPPELAAAHVWYRRLISAALHDYPERGGRARS